MADWWRMYAQRDNGCHGQRRQYSGSEKLEDFEDLTHWFLSQGFVVICVKEQKQDGNNAENTSHVE